MHVHEMNFSLSFVLSLSFPCLREFSLFLFPVFSPSARTCSLFPCVFLTGDVGRSHRRKVLNLSDFESRFIFEEPEEVIEEVLQSNSGTRASGSNRDSFLRQ